MPQDFSLTPPSASTFAPQVDALYWFLVILSTVVTVGIFAAALFLSIRYRRKPGVAPGNIEGSLKLELLWSFIPGVLAIGIFAWGAKVYFYGVRPPADVMDFYVSGKQWMWKVQHPTGQREINDLHIPVGRAIRFTMTSEDVLHSYWIPAMRMKKDTVPGRYTEMWFQPTMTGKFHIQCAEYCGTKHSGMIGECYVLEPEEYQRWLSGNTGDPPEVAGQKLFENLRCVTCHMAGAGQRGPDLAGLYGTKIQLEGGGEVVMNDEYIRESILKPLAKRVKGFEPVMNTYEGQVGEEEIMQLVAYIKSLKAQGGGKQ
jgi:cytochrome c oxidase subunit II